jgi:hypothetical protein
MAPHGVLNELLRYASTSRLKSAVSLAAISFAVCHVAVMATAPGPAAITGDLDGDIPRQLLHFGAVLCRFALPLLVMIGAMRHRGHTSKIR